MMRFAKTIRRALMVAAFCAGGGAWAADVGVGVHLGGAGNRHGSHGFSGLNLRVGQDKTLELNLAFNDGGETIIVNGNYLNHFRPVLREIPIKGIVPYAGIGVGTWINDNSGFWVQVPLGIDFRFSVPVEVSLTVAPGIDIMPETQANVHYGVGIRYWFD